MICRNFKNVNQLMDYHENYIRVLLKDGKDIQPMAIVEKNEEINIFLLSLADRHDIHSILDTMAKTKPTWIVFMNEGYSLKVENIKKDELENLMRTFKAGDLEKRFKSGDKEIIEIVTVQAYMKDGKLMRIIDKNSLKVLSNSEEFDGYLAVNDVERVFFKSNTKINT